MFVCLLSCLFAYLFVCLFNFVLASYFFKERKQTSFGVVELLIAVDSWFALKYQDTSAYLDTIRACYEVGWHSGMWFFITTFTAFSSLSML